jgi:ATP-dependent DNA ligase
VWEIQPSDGAAPRSIKFNTQHQDGGSFGWLHPVGFTSAFKASERRGLTKKFEALRKPPGSTGSAPGGPSRWSTDRTNEWEPVDPRVVVEVAYDHFTGGRFRHGTKFLRWRPDKDSRQCTMDQVEHREGKSFALLQP